MWELHYGLITFYSAQVQEIRQTLDVYAYRVRLSPAHAFLGMQLDVIYLSPVSYHTLPPHGSDDLLKMDLDDVGKESETYSASRFYVDKLGMSAYGFLTSDNRLCVMMSLHRKLLDKEGDSDISDGETLGDVINHVFLPDSRFIYSPLGPTNILGAYSG